MRIMPASLQTHQNMNGILPRSEVLRTAVSPKMRCVKPVRSTCGRRAVNTSASDRPIVQISLKDFENRKREIAADLWKAATDVGFFYLKDHELTEVCWLLLQLQHARQ